MCISPGHGANTGTTRKAPVGLCGSWTGTRNIFSEGLLHGRAVPVNNKQTKHKLKLEEHMLKWRLVASALRQRCCRSFYWWRWKHGGDGRFVQYAKLAYASGRLSFPALEQRLRYARLTIPACKLLPTPFDSHFGAALAYAISFLCGLLQSSSGDAAASEDREQF